MTTKDEPKVEVKFLDNPHAPEVFATEAVGFLLHAGNVHITFATPRVNHETTPGPVNRVVHARLVMPIQSAQGLAAGLYDYLKKSGYDPVPKSTSESLQ